MDVVAIELLDVDDVDVVEPGDDLTAGPAGTTAASGLQHGRCSSAPHCHPIFTPPEELGTA